MAGLQGGTFLPVGQRPSKSLLLPAGISSMLATSAAQWRLNETERHMATVCDMFVIQNGADSLLLQNSFASRDVIICTKMSAPVCCLVLLHKNFSCVPMC
ncbi:hypothetical protein ABBQ38_003448 [Trebouxia sp. C0009 RCD-2024]